MWLTLRVSRFSQQLRPRLEEHDALSAPYLTRRLSGASTCGSIGYGAANCGPSTVPGAATATDRDSGSARAIPTGTLAARGPGRLGGRGAAGARQFTYQTYCQIRHLFTEKQMGLRQIE